MCIAAGFLPHLLLCYHPTDVVPPSLTSIMVCASHLCCGLEIVIVLIGSLRVCSSSMVSVWMAMRRLACVGFVPAAVLVCQNVFWPCAWLVHIPCQHHSSMRCGYYCCWGNITFSTYPKTRISVLWVCCFIPFVLSRIGRLCVHFVPLMFQQRFLVECHKNCIVGWGGAFVEKTKQWKIYKAQCLCLSELWSIWRLFI